MTTSIPSSDMPLASGEVEVPNVSTESEANAQQMLAALKREDAPLSPSNLASIDDGSNYSDVSSGYSRPKKLKKKHRMGSKTQAEELGKSSGRWTREEHLRFVKALQLFGRDWKKVEDYVATRTGAQIRSHAQKYFNRIQREFNTADPAQFVSSGALELIKINDPAEVHPTHMCSSSNLIPEDHRPLGPPTQRKNSLTSSTTLSDNEGLNMAQQLLMNVAVKAQQQANIAAALNPVAPRLQLSSGVSQNSLQNELLERAIIQHEKDNATLVNSLKGPLEAQEGGEAYINILLSQLLSVYSNMFNTYIEAQKDPLRKILIDHLLAERIIGSLQEVDNLIKHLIALKSKKQAPVTRVNPVGTSEPPIHISNDIIKSLSQHYSRLSDLVEMSEKGEKDKENHCPQNKTQVDQTQKEKQPLGSRSIQPVSMPIAHTIVKPQPVRPRIAFEGLASDNGLKSTKKEIEENASSNFKRIRSTSIEREIQPFLEENEGLIMQRKRSKTE